MLISMAKLQQPLAKSSKGSIIRRAAERRFQEASENAYDFKQSADGGRDVPDDELEPIIMQIANSAMAENSDLTPMIDFFPFDANSVAGIHIRGMTRRWLPAAAHQLPIRLIEDCGTAELSTHSFRRRRHGETGASDADGTDELEYMRMLVDTHITFNDGIIRDSFNNGHASPEAKDRDVIVLAGTTGASTRRPRPGSISIK